VCVCVCVCTLRMPLASISKVTTICGTPALARSIPSITNLPAEGWVCVRESRCVCERERERERCVRERESPTQPAASAPCHSQALCL
jgi:hypothetical protein